MKIAFITSFPPSRHALNEYGFHVAEQLRGEPSVELTVLGDCLPAPAPELPGFHVIRCWDFGDWKNLFSVFRTLRQVQPDVAWFNLGFASFGNRPVSALLGLATPAAARLVGAYSHVTLHQLFETVNLEDAAVAFPRLYRAGGWLGTQLLLSASSVSVLLPAYRRILNEKYGRGRVSARSHGIFAGKPDPPDFSRRANPHHRVLAFGKWGTYKRLELLIEAFERLASNAPGAKLIVGGGDHPKTPGYIAGTAQRHASDSISFLGYVPEESIANLFREASLIVMPYTSSAGSSGVAHLAAQYGVPVLASDIQDFRDLAKDERIAIRFFQPGNVDDLAEQMRTILAAPTELRAMAWQNYSAGVAMSMPRIVRQYLQTFRQSERIETLQQAARLRRDGERAADEIGIAVGNKLQRWSEEEERAEIVPGTAG